MKACIVTSDPLRSAASLRRVSKLGALLIASVLVLAGCGCGCTAAPPRNTDEMEAWCRTSEGQAALMRRRGLSAPSATGPWSDAQLSLCYGVYERAAP